MSLVRKLDFGKHEPLKNTFMHIDLPHQVVMGNDVSGLLNYRASAERTRHSIGVGARNLVLELLASRSGLRALDRKPGLALFGANADIAAVKSGNQSIAQLSAGDRGTLPSIVGYQKFALNLDRQSTAFRVSFSPEPIEAAPIIAYRVLVASTTMFQGWTEWTRRIVTTRSNVQSPRRGGACPTGSTRRSLQ